MASHTRHIRREFNSGRHQIRFVRDELLWIGGTIISPHDGQAASVPIPVGAHVVGPNLLGMLDRQIVRWCDMPNLVRPTGASPKKHVAVWKIRDSDELWPAPGQSQRLKQQAREPEIEDGQEDVPDHPFLCKFCAGGIPIAGAPHGFQRVRKASTVNIAEVVFRQAVAMHNSDVGMAYTEIARLAEAYWADDLRRSYGIWTAIDAAGGLLIENERVIQMRPKCSLSQAVEQEIGRQVLLWLGVDTDALFSALPGQLDVALAAHGGSALHTFTDFVTDPRVLRDRAAAIQCRAGQTRLLDIMDRVREEEGVKVIVYIGDVFEESLGRGIEVADSLRLRGTKLVVLHDTATGGHHDADVFAQLAVRTGGCVMPFDGSAIDRLGEMLEALAVLAVGGVKLLEAKTKALPAARLLLESLSDK